VAAPPFPVLDRPGLNLRTEESEMSTEAVARDRVGVALTCAAVDEGLGDAKQPRHLCDCQVVELETPVGGTTRYRYWAYRSACRFHAVIELYWAPHVYSRSL